MERSQNLTSTRVRPRVSELICLEVLRRDRISPHMARVTLGRGDIGRFEPMGFDQWFRVFIPASREHEGTLARLPQRLGVVQYVRYLMIAKGTRPVLRNYSVRAFRPDGPHGPELDVDVVLHGSFEDGTAGPAAAWAQTCEAGDQVAILDEGIGFHPDPSLRRVLLVADESGLSATAGILASLPAETTGQALIEIPTDEDRQSLVAPAGVEITWIARTDATSVPGQAVLAAARALPLPNEPFHGWAVGEQTLAVSTRRHWVEAGVPKDRIMFCAYWKADRERHP